MHSFAQFRLFLVGCTLVLSSGHPVVAAEAPPSVTFTVRDLSGASHAAAENDAAATVWLFIAPDCPICNTYAPEIARIIDSYTPRGVRVNLVYTDPDLTLAALTAHARERNYRTALFLEANGPITRACGITITPEVAVIDAHGALVYRGRIDNRFITIGRERHEVTAHDLRDALDATLAGRPVATPRTAAIGCAN